MTTQAKRPNILWLCSDQQRFDTLGCYGNRFVQTPNLDRLASSGARFTHCFAQSPVCTSSRACMLTGRYPRTSGARQNGQRINPTERLISRILADQGYNCGLVGKLHLAACEPVNGGRMEERIDDGYSQFHWSHDPRPCWPDNEYIQWLSDKGVEYSTPDRKDCPWVQVGMPEEHHQTTWCAEKAIEFIRDGAAQEDPWLLSVNFFDPHHPFDPPTAYLERYLETLEEIPLPDFDPEELGRRPEYLATSHKHAYNVPGLYPYGELTERDHRMIRAAYWAMCDLLDVHIGRILKALESSGQLENTIVIYNSDHGELLGDHGAYLKGPHLYDCCVHVPLIFSRPGQIKAGFVSNTLVELTDMAPTLLELCGLPVPRAMQGRSFASCLTSGDSGYVHRTSVLTEYYNAAPAYFGLRPYATMLRTNEHKLVVYHGCETGEMFDLKADPQENRNRWGDPELLGTQAQLMKQLCDRMAWTADPLPEREANW